MELSREDVIQILKLIDEAPIGRFSLEVGDLKLEVAKGTENTIIPPPERPPTETPARRTDVAASTQAETSVPLLGEGATSHSPTASNVQLRQIAAPLLGIFYRRPEPGAPCYVEVGSLVEEDTTVALIEVMKLFNPVKAGMRGRIARICVENGDLVEYGQNLFEVGPE